MKRFAFWLIAASVAIYALRSHRRHEEPDRGGTVVVHRVAPNGPSHAEYYVEGNENRLYPTLAGLRASYGDRIVFAFDDQDDNDAKSGRVRVDGLPVNVVPGSRVTDARIEPPRPPKPPKAPKAPAKKAKRPEPPKPPEVPPAVETASITGRLSGDEERAKQDAELKFSKLLIEKLDGQIDPSWKIPSSVLRSMILETEVIRHDRDYGPVYDATIKVDVSPNRREAVVSAYHHDKVMKRLVMMGGGLAFLLTCLGAVSGYIRSDEATKGYYTNALRIALAGGVGAAGLAIYHAIA